MDISLAVSDSGSAPDETKLLCDSSFDAEESVSSSAFAILADIPSQQRQLQKEQEQEPLEQSSFEFNSDPSTILRDSSIVVTSPSSVTTSSIMKENVNHDSETGVGSSSKRSDDSQVSTTTNSDSVHPVTTGRNRRVHLSLAAIGLLILLCAVTGTTAYLLMTKAPSPLPMEQEPVSDTTILDSENGAPNEIPDTTHDSSITTSKGGSSTSSPTSAPSSNNAYFQIALQVTDPSDLQNASSPQSRAVRWLHDMENADAGRVEVDYKRFKRYIITVLDFALTNSTAATTEKLSRRLGETPRFAKAGVDECQWTGIQCRSAITTTADADATTTSPSNDEEVGSAILTTLNWANQQLTGSIPSEIGFLTHLTTLDLAENEISGPIPDELYNLTALQNLYLHRNLLEGSISNRIGQLTELQRFYAGNNKLSGSIPDNSITNPYADRLDALPLRYLSLHNNQLTGTLPSNVKWRNMFYLDLSRNRFVGTVPFQWVGDMTLLRHFIVDHNDLTGSLPQNWTLIGRGRLEQLLISHNHFTGTMPGDFLVKNFLQQAEMHRNNLTEINRDLCSLVVFEGGEIVNLKANCEVCDCNYFCEAGECYE